MVHHSGLRKMTVADGAAVQEIEILVDVSPWPEKLFADCIKVGYEAWVLVEDKQVIGYGILSFAANEAHVLKLVVAPSKQRQGHGQKLLQHLLDIAKMNGAEEIFLEVRQSNVIAQELYKKFNFVEIGIRKDYYVDGKDGEIKEDALTFAMPLW